VSLIAIAGVPILLTGAALVGLPILLHLIMRQEPKRLPFPAFRFLKQRRQINQRKIRLRHLLLLLLRMALIALICLSLFQPTVLSQGFSLRSDRPVAAVIIIDTSPSMGYVLLSERSGLTEARQHRLKLLDESGEGPWTCLDDARGLVMEMLEDLPPASKVAIIDTAERGEPMWVAGLPEARQRVRDLKKPRANSQPITSRALESAYTLLARADNELEPGQEPYPRLLAVFSDRTVPSWDPNRMAELQSLRDRVPPPNVYHVYVDVGVDKPVNTAITTFEMKPQIVPANQPVVINVTVEATGGAVHNILQLLVDGEEPQRQPVNPGPDRPITHQFVKTGLKPGLHQAKLSLNTSDALPFDNEKYITFRVREPRNVLALVDAPQAAVLGALGVPGAAESQAGEWKRVLDAKGWYNCEVRQVGDAEAGRIDWGRYEQVTLLDVAQPSPDLWKLLDQYVKKGGHLIVTPAGPWMDVSKYQTKAARDLLPRLFERWVELPPRESVTWTWGAALNPTRPLLAIFRQDEDNQFYKNTPPITSGFWEVDGGNRDRIVVAYNNAPTADERSPAVLEWGPGGTAGRVIQFTVPMGLGSSRFHNYASSWFYLVLVNEAVRTLVGDTEDQVFNFTAGQNVVIKWPTGDVKPGTTYFLSGPDVTANDATIRREEGQAYLRFGPEKTGSAGSFTVTSEDGKWSDGFSLNAPVEESNLERLPPESVQELFGANAVRAADKKLELKDILSGEFTQPIELFPLLMILLLIVLAVENWMGNTFYRKKRVPA
jgi:Aerotolerance regulator N-terminal